MRPFTLVAHSAVARARCLEIRRQVFVEEQLVPEEEEWDGLDDDCIHLLALPSAQASYCHAMGTARLWVSPGGVAKAQRVAVCAHARGFGVGVALMNHLAQIVKAQGHRELVLGAQLHALGFYARLGYQVYGGVFVDAGIPHRMMSLNLSR